jgi:HlyD family secretion protein
MNKKLKWFLIVVGSLLGIFIIIKILAGGGSDAVKVSTEKSARRTIVETVTASGKVYPEVEVKISPDISGQITELKVEEGDSVRKGQVLARIYADIYALQRDEAASRVSQSVATVENSKAALTALEATLDQAKNTLERNRKLFEQKVISRAEFEQFELSYQTALSNYNAAKQNIRSLQANVQSSQTGLNKANKDLGRTTITAPMDGVISSLKVKEGESVAGSGFNVGTEMMTVADMSVIEVRVDVGENDIVKISIGDSADVEVDAYSNRKFKGVVTKIASSTRTSAASLTTNDVTNYEIRIRLDKSSYADLAGRTFPFRPGMNASADIKTKRVENVVTVPIGAVNARVRGTDESISEQKAENEKKQEEEGVEVAENTDEMELVVFVRQQDGTVKRRVVQTGIQDLNYIEITGGLEAGEEIVSGPYTAVSKTLKDGSTVEVVSKDELFEN